MKFETYSKVRFKKTVKGDWIILSPTVDVHHANNLKFIEDSYVIMSLNDTHPEKLQIVSASKIEPL